MKNTNRFLTKDIKMHVDSVGGWTVTHAYQGVLVDSEFFENGRRGAYRAASDYLKQLKEEHELNQVIED